MASERSGHRKSSLRKGLLKVLQNLQENTCVGEGLKLLRKRIWHRYFPVNFTKFSKNIFFIEHFQVPSLLLLLESPIFWGLFLQTYLMDICGSFRLLCKCFRFIYRVIMIIQIVLTLRKFVLYVCWLNKMPPNFLVWISELM